MLSRNAQNLQQLAMGGNPSRYKSPVSSFATRHSVAPAASPSSPAQANPAAATGDKVPEISSMAMGLLGQNSGTPGSNFGAYEPRDAISRAMDAATNKGLASYGADFLGGKATNAALNAGLAYTAGVPGEYMSKVAAHGFAGTPSGTMANLAMRVAPAAYGRVMNERRLRDDLAPFTEDPMYSGLDDVGAVNSVVGDIETSPQEYDDFATAAYNERTKAQERMSAMSLKDLLTHTSRNIFDDDYEPDRYDAFDAEDMNVAANQSDASHLADNPTQVGYDTVDPVSVGTDPMSGGILYPTVGYSKVGGFGRNEAAERSTERGMEVGMGVDYGMTGYSAIGGFGRHGGGGADAGGSTGDGRGQGGSRGGGRSDDGGGYR